MIGGDTRGVTMAGMIAGQMIEVSWTKYVEKMQEKHEELTWQKVGGWR